MWNHNEKSQTFPKAGFVQALLPTYNARKLEINFKLNFKTSSTWQTITHPHKPKKQVPPGLPTKPRTFQGPPLPNTPLFTWKQAQPYPPTSNIPFYWGRFRLGMWGLKGSEQSQPSIHLPQTWTFTCSQMTLESSFLFWRMAQMKSACRGCRVIGDTSWEGLEQGVSTCRWRIILADTLV